MEEVKSLTWTKDGMVAEKMERCAGKMRESLCKAVASYRYALNSSQCEGE